MAGGGELVAQRAEVVNFAVEDHPYGTVLVVDRLLAGGQVDDGQAAHAQRDAVGEVCTLIVGPAMPDDIAHTLNEELLRIPVER
jgi:hypothetical protein